jgi:Domain of unknown function (DUF3291)
MASYHLAQINVAHALAPLDTPLLADFMGALDDINRLAEESPGFVWRLQSDSGNATDVRHGDDPLFIVNMSVWQSAETLFDFVYRTLHTKIMARRREWFARPSSAFQVLWWIPAGTTPTVEEAMARLAHLQAHGPTPHAFTFKARFAAPDASEPTPPLVPDPYCSSWSA